MPYVRIPWILVPIVITTELTRNSRIFLAATYIGSDAETIAALKTYKATKLGNDQKVQYISSSTYKEMKMLDKVLCIFRKDGW